MSGAVVLVLCGRYVLTNHSAYFEHSSCGNEIIDFSFLSLLLTPSRIKSTHHMTNYLCSIQSQFLADLVLPGYGL